MGEQSMIQPAVDVRPDAHAAVAAGADHVDLFQRLHLENEADKTVWDKVTNSSDGNKNRQIDSMLNGFGIGDPAKFDSNLHRLVDRASSQHADLNQKTLDAYSHDTSLPVEARHTAQFLHDHMREFATSQYFSSVLPQSFLKVLPDDVSFVDRQAGELEAARAHPELHDPKTFAAVAESLPNPRGTLYNEELSGSFADHRGLTDIQKVVANDLGDNYSKFVALSHTSSGIDAQVMHNISDVGHPRTAQWLQGCISGDSVNVLGAATESALIGGGTTAALGGDRKSTTRSAVTAAGVAAVVAAVHNADVQAACQREFDATQ